MDDTRDKVPKIEIDVEDDGTLVIIPSYPGAVITNSLFPQQEMKSHFKSAKQPKSNLLPLKTDMDHDVDAKDEEVMPHLLQQQLKAHVKSKQEKPIPDMNKPASKEEDEELVLLRCTMTSRLILQQKIKVHFNWSHLHEICDLEKKLLLLMKQNCESATTKTTNKTSSKTETTHYPPYQDYKFSSIHDKMEELFRFKKDGPSIEPAKYPPSRISRRHQNSKFSSIHNKMEKLLKLKNNGYNTKSIKHSSPNFSRVRPQHNNKLTLHEQTKVNFGWGHHLQGIYDLKKVNRNEPTKATKVSPPNLSHHNGRPHRHYKYTLIHGTVFPNGNTALHEILNVGSAPRSLIEKILYLWRGALWERNKYGDTPIHVATRNAQITSHRVQMLVEACCNVDDDLSKIDSAPRALIPGCGTSSSISTLASPTSALELLQYRNKAGETPLGTACASIASFTVLKLLVAKCPRALHIRNLHGHTPIEAMWGSFQKNFLGVSSIAKYLKAHKKYATSSNSGVIATVEGDMEKPEMSQFLQKFWTKFCFCIMKSYEYDQRRHQWQEGREQEAQSHRSAIADETCVIEGRSDNDDSEQEMYQNHPMLIHAILAHGITQDLRTLLSIALSYNPNLGMKVDSDGNTPLHAVVSLSSVSLNRITTSNKRISTFYSQKINTRTHTPIISDIKTITILLEKCKKSAGIANNSGRFTLHLALDKYWDADEGIRNGFWRNRRICDIMTANVDALEYFDPVGGSTTVTNIDASKNNDDNSEGSTKYFFPFMVAALHCDVEMTFEMLKRKPMVIFHTNM